MSEIATWAGEEARKRDVVEGIRGQLDAGEEGLAIGCLSESDPGIHSALAAAHGNPEWLYHVMDRVYEGLAGAGEPAREWPLQLLAAIPVGIGEDALGRARSRMSLWSLTAERFGAVRQPMGHRGPGARTLIKRVADALCDRDRLQAQAGDRSGPAAALRDAGDAAGAAAGACEPGSVEGDALQAAAIAARVELDHVPPDAVKALASAAYHAAAAPVRQRWWPTYAEQLLDALRMEADARA